MFQHQPGANLEILQGDNFSSVWALKGVYCYFVFDDFFLLSKYKRSIYKRTRVDGIWLGVERIGTNSSRMFRDGEKSREPVNRPNAEQTTGYSTRLMIEN